MIINNDKNEVCLFIYFNNRNKKKFPQHDYRTRVGVKRREREADFARSLR